MSDIYVMQRANGDLFTFNDRESSRIPVFRSSSDGYLARFRNFEMRLFKPVQLDDSLLGQLEPLGGAAKVEFWLVSEPFLNLNRGRLLQPSQLAGLLGSRDKLKPVSGNATSDKIQNLSVPPSNNSNAKAVWEDEGGLSPKSA
jgi:hypothetical protein